MLTVFFIILLILAIAIVVLLLPIIAIIDILNSKFQGNDNLLMLLIVLFVPLGAILYFFIRPYKKIRV